MSESRERSRVRRIVVRGLLVVGGTFVGLFLAWLAIVVYDAVRPGPRPITAKDHFALVRMLDWNRGPRGLYRFDPVVGYVFKENFSGIRHESEEFPHETNSLGLLGGDEVNPDPSVRKVLFLGDSVTYGDGVPYERIFVSEMQTLAGDGYELRNGACPGWNAKQQIDFFDEHVREWGVDWSAVVFVVCLNDFAEFEWMERDGGYDRLLSDTGNTFASLRRSWLRGGFHGPCSPLADHDDATLLAWNSARLSEHLEAVWGPFLGDPNRPPIIVVVMPTRHQFEALAAGCDPSVALRPQRRLAAFLGDRDVPTVDVGGLLQVDKPRSATGLYKPADALHFSAEGHAGVATRIWPALREVLASAARGRARDASKSR